MVEAKREANWMVYRLAAKPSAELKANLACLQDCTREQPIFQRDYKKLRRLHGKFADASPICRPPTAKKSAAVLVRA
jgi:ArsR family transcriptional regulator, arsenate/arsenite/antimonite-responsive transcriptional repressor